MPRRVSLGSARAASPASSIDPRTVLFAMPSSALPTPVPASASVAAVCTTRVAADRGRLLGTCSVIGTISAGSGLSPFIHSSHCRTSGQVWLVAVLPATSPKCPATNVAS